MKKEELSEEKKNLIKKLSGLVDKVSGLDDKVSGLELCPRCSHYICLKNGKCPHCGLVKKGDEWIMTKEAIKEKEKEKEVKEEEKTYGNLFGSILTFDKGKKDEKEDKEKE